MTEVSHVYMTVHGEYSSVLWNEEHAQFGVRLAFAPTVSAPSMGETFTPALNGDAVPAFGTDTSTHGTLTKTWEMRIGPTGSTENFDAAAQMDCAEDVWTFLNAIKAYTSQYFRWTHVKFAAISAAGNTVGTASTYTFTTPLAGTGTTLLPPQVAVALTMRANIVGRKGRGRIYLPALPQSIVGSNGNLSGTPVTAISAAFKTLIDDLQSLPGITVNIPLVVVTSAGALTAVRPAEIRIGDKFDTIKSRRAQQDEVYTSTSL